MAGDPSDARRGPGASRGARCCWTEERERRLKSVGLVLDWLERLPGETWQQRWLASGADAAGERWVDGVGELSGLANGRDGRAQLTGGVTRLLMLGVVRPSYYWLYRWHSPILVRLLRDRRDPEGFARLDPLCERMPRFTPSIAGSPTGYTLRILLHNGGRLADITVPDCVEAYRAMVGHAPPAPQLVRAAPRGGHSPRRHAADRVGGQPSRSLTVEEIVDVYGVTAGPSGICSSLICANGARPSTTARWCQLATKLVLLFWRDLELHEPGIGSLHLAEPLARAWKERLHRVHHGNDRIGKRRQDRHPILLAVRGFYADLNQWALEDPGRWRRWAAPNPVIARDLADQHKHIRRQHARMHQRTRGLAAVLPALVGMAVARQAARCRGARDYRPRTIGQIVVVHVTSPGPAVYVTDPARGGTGRPGAVYADDPAHEAPAQPHTRGGIRLLGMGGGRRTPPHGSTARGDARDHPPQLRGVHAAQHRGGDSPLQITPSKTDRERLLVVGPELSEVLQRDHHSRQSRHRQAPLVSRYDHAEPPPQPGAALFVSAPCGLRPQVMTTIRVGQLLDETMDATGLSAADGRPLRSARMTFAASLPLRRWPPGLPIHIAAKLLGHESFGDHAGVTLRCTEDQDVVDHHRAFIARRRPCGPARSTASPRRGVGRVPRPLREAQGRARGLRQRLCNGLHPRACVLRCPSSGPDPNQLREAGSRFEANSSPARRGPAARVARRVEGLEVSLAGAEQKLAVMQRLADTLKE